MEQRENPHLYKLSVYPYFEFNGNEKKRTQVLILNMIIEEEAFYLIILISFSILLLLNKILIFN
jgi:hypothetical protein